jgi:hypothetical protein
MRFIDIDELRGPAEFEALIADADQAKALVAAAPDSAERKRLIGLNRARWVAFREPFERLSNEKCWYTESRSAGADGDIDHFRPKSNVAGCPTHGGYWWEAFEWTNFRFSSQRSNRRRKNPETGKTQGKGDYFPVADESDRWQGPSEVCRERPLLLDPTDPLDPPMLTFDQAGRAELVPAYDDEAGAAERIEASRLYLHLDWPQFVEDRTSLYGTVTRSIKDGDRVAQAALDDRDPAAMSALKSVAADLIRLTRSNTPYSRAAEACIRRYRDRIWIRRTVLPYVSPEIT